MIAQDSAENVQPDRPVGKRRAIVKAFFIVVLIFLLLWLGWPLYSLLRKGESVPVPTITNTIREIISDPRAAILGTTLRIRTVVQNQGGSGAQGDRGPTGSPGPRGTRGLTGTTGPRGADGNAGANGSQGVSGATVDAFVQNGNSFGNTATLGTNDSFSLAFETADIQRAIMDTSGNFQLNAGNLLVNGNFGLGNLSAVDLATNVLHINTTGSLTPTSGDHVLAQLTSEYTPTAADPSDMFRGLRMNLTTNAGDGTEIFDQRGLVVNLINNSTGTVGELQPIFAFAENNGTVNDRNGMILSGEFSNNGTLADVDTRTAQFLLTNGAAGTVSNHFGVVSKIVNAGTFSGAATGFYAELMNTTGTVSSGAMQGFRSLIDNDNTAQSMLGSYLTLSNSGTVTTDIIGQQINFENTGTVTDDVFGLQINDDVVTQVSDSAYGIYLDSINAGDVNNYGLWISGAGGGTGDNASIWVDSGFSRFAQINVIDSVGSDVAVFTNGGDSTSNTGLLIQVGENTPVGTNRLITFNDGDGDEVGSIEFNSTNTLYNTTSDVRLKTDITPTELTLETLMNIQVYDYNWKDHPTESKVHGFVAQDLFEVYPQAVSRPSDPEKFWSVDYSKLVPLAVKGIQDQQGQIDDLSEQVGNLKSLAQGEISQVAEWSQEAWTFVTEVVFKAKAKFTESVEFLSTVIFKSTASFLSEVNFGKRVTFKDKDMGGVMVIPAGATAARVTFDQVFTAAPVITLTPRGVVVTIALDEVGTEGFSVKLASPLSQDFSVSWIALQVSGQGEPQTQVLGVETRPTPVPTPGSTPEPTPSVTPTPNPTPDSAPEASGSGEAN